MENYKLIKQIGEGSYGKVQLAVASDGKQVVIKVMLYFGRYSRSFSAASTTNRPIKCDHVEAVGQDKSLIRAQTLG